jgi:hypothetical protein
MRQRVVVLVGLAAALLVFGGWLTTRGEGGGWVAYAPLSSSINSDGLRPGLHSWVRLLIWLVLIAIWIIVGLFLLRSRIDRNSSAPAE